FQVNFMSDFKDVRDSLKRCGDLISAGCKKTGLINDYLLKVKNGLERNETTLIHNLADCGFCEVQEVVVSYENYREGLLGLFEACSKYLVNREDKDIFVQALKDCEKLNDFYENDFSRFQDSAVERIFGFMKQEKF
ncbi:hypothetical protein COZ55_02375, partial [archaeon CG_4_8_14_3_um_filter_38_5]